MSEIKKGIYTGLRGLGHFTNAIIAGAKSSSFSEGVKAGINASGYGVSKAIWDNNHDISLLAANRIACGLDPETGVMLDSTKVAFIIGAMKIIERYGYINIEPISEADKIRKKERMAETLPTAKAHVNKSIESESRFLSGNHQNVMKKYMDAKGKKILLEKAKELKNAMASIISNLGNSIMYSKDYTTGQYLVNISQGISSDYGTVDLTKVFDLVNNKISDEQKNQFSDMIMALKNNQYAFNDVNISLSINYPDINISTSNNLTSEISTAEYAFSDAERLFNKVKEVSNEKEKKAMERVESSCTTLYSKVPEYSLEFEKLNNKKKKSHSV